MHCDIAVKGAESAARRDRASRKIQPQKLEIRDATTVDLERKAVTLIRDDKGLLRSFPWLLL